MVTLTAPTTATTGTSTDRVAAAIAYARAQIGKPYKWGTAGPDSFDCSGLTSASYAAAGMSIPHFTGAQMALGSVVSKADLQPGDLVFTALNHVQLYTGGGNVVEAAAPGTKVREVPMWGFLTARRMVNPDGSAKSSIPIIGPVIDAATSATSAATSLTDPNTWVQAGLKLAAAGLGLALLLVGASKIVAPVAGNALNQVKDVVL